MIGPEVNCPFLDYCSNCPMVLHHGMMVVSQDGESG